MSQHPSDDVEDLGKEIDRLWARVASSSVREIDSPLAPVDAELPGKALAWETVALLKRQHRHESQYWGEALESKERALRAAQERGARLETENAALKARVQSDESRLISEGLKVQATLEAAMATFEAERRQGDDERRSLRALLDQTRQRLAAEDARWKAEQREWEKKEQQYLLDLRELQVLAARHQQESGQASDESRRRADSLKEAKNALEKTLAELLRERQVRAQSEQEREKAVKKVDDVEKHLQELSRLWDEERAQWRELWDRERSTWEAQRQEFSGWEERLRKEREAWHAELEAKEKDQLRFTDQMTRTLRDTTELSTKMGAMLRSQTQAPPRVSPRARRLALAGVLLAVAGLPLWRYAARFHFTPVSVQALSIQEPTALGFDGTLLWLAGWDGRLQGYDPQNLDAAVRSATLDAGVYRPVSLVFGEESLWSLDAAQGRLVRHQASDPSKVISVRPSPGPAPTALAFDGAGVWSYDAANRALYQHGPDGALDKTFALDRDLVVTAMAWVDGHLWAFDSKSRYLVDFKFGQGVFREAGRYPFEEAVVGLSASAGLVDGRRRPQLWILAGPSGQRAAPALVKYAY